jgi:SAM-dependent methyltransferase
MKEEKFFDADGFYQFIVESNCILHREGVEYGRQAVEGLVKDLSFDQELKVLDLACGGNPISICQILSSFNDVSFDYTGIDINPGQVKLASTKFEFPVNVKHVNIIEGDAWNFPDFISQTRYDIIFTGLNLHHGSPRELFVLFRCILKRLKPGGVFINHDMYRPVDKTYIIRPEANPKDPSESYLMIPKKDLELENIPEFNFKGIPYSEVGDDDWRLEFLDGFSRVLKERGGDEIGIKSACAHVYARDFCLTPYEMKVIADSAGFISVVKDYEFSSEPLKKYYATIIGKVA